MEVTEGRLLLINKPLNWTSFDVVNKLRYKLKTKKIGHAGTLDPLATGLLIICTGKMTKRIDDYQAKEKEYTGHFVIGQTTPSHDLETEVSPPEDVSMITNEQLIGVAKKFIGEIQQIPPLHSAIKVDGKRAYKLARQGSDLELKARTVTVSEFEITSIQKPIVTFRIVCSKGTYIRSLARDFGKAIGTGAYLGSLCRTRIGDFLLSDAKTLEQIDPV
ncbi:MAG: tRNA pseudouridine(55) synthase TruB [Cytophagales bacterium]|jgi:tRNA pseudouridine55 synthase|nr:tRNA pseudouridine(55) synthase TruB [Cytophagales bacterium]MCA6387900.1 tRNA pseudouridine(55) synthase TruB [Cytophagales bacterium]MCA6390980.1 tRNA pseudouridine(55) synthase TruB [Cytophagales bacterium]MCA6393943.1 tRNA pseudouridine(55) synthase TruB [Cytophagales bacterium]MCA6398344.1 tRNA pseudouridine(55) synthase TruB [Cytophagales bacterium]